MAPRPPEDFFAQLSRLDRGIAQRWTRATGIRDRWGADKNGITFAPMLTADRVNIIVLPLLDRPVSERECLALTYLVFNAAFTPDGMAQLKLVVELLDAGSAFVAAAIKSGKNATADEIKAIQGELAQGAARIAFTSPQTQFAYRPAHFTATGKLIDEKKIKVRMVRMGGINTLTGLASGGSYFPKVKELYLYDGLTPAFRRETIVHEAAHAVQDFAGIDITQEFAETDAHIIGRMATLAAGFPRAANRGNDGPIYDAADAALKGSLTKDQYLAARDAVLAVHLPAADRNIKFQQDTRKRARAEKQTWMRLMNAVDRKQSGAAAQ